MGLNVGRKRLVNARHPVKCPDGDTTIGFEALPLVSTFLDPGIFVSPGGPVVKPIEGLFVPRGFKCHAHPNPLVVPAVRIKAL